MKKYKTGDKVRLIYKGGSPGAAVNSMEIGDVGVFVGKRNEGVNQYTIIYGVNKVEGYVSDHHIELVTSAPDVTKPEHYHRGAIDVIKFAEENFTKEALAGFFKINVIKYVTRYDVKGGLDDLQKAQVYLDKLVKLEKESIQ